MKTVLVVEDTDDLRELFMEVLRGAGYNVLGAENGQRALDVLEALGDENPCVVLLDMMMPVMDGQTFLQTVHHTHRWASLPIVVVSAVSSEKTALGARKLVKKPVSPAALLQVVQEFCCSA